MGWAHWRSFCSRFHRLIFLTSETQSERAVAAAQARLFLCYETACFDQKATSAAQKLWAAGVHHKAALRPDPFVGNPLVKAMLTGACALDEPSKQKIPVTNTRLAALRDKLDLQTRPYFTFWTGICFAIVSYVASQSGRLTTCTQSSGNMCSFGRQSTLRVGTGASD